MSVFEYVASIYSVVLALSAASTLSALADTIKHWRTIRTYWVHTAWCVTFLGMHLALWRGIWFNNVDRASLDFFDLLPYFQFVVGWYIASRLLAPDADEVRVVDLEAHFLGIRRAFFMCLLLPLLINAVWLEMTPEGLLNAPPLVAATLVGQLLVGVVGWFATSRMVHGWLVGSMFVLTLLQESLQGAID